MSAENIRVMYPLFQAGKGGSIPTSALSLFVETTDYAWAKKLNQAWHSTLPRIGDPESVMVGGVHYAATYQGIIYAIAIWTHPVSRSLPKDSWLELRRLAIAPDAPRNTASRILAVMAKLILVAKPLITTLVSYQDMEAHSGCIYRAAGWTPTIISKRKNWSSSARYRPAAQRPTNKQRWEKVIRKPQGTTMKRQDKTVKYAMLFEWLKATNIGGNATDNLYGIEGEQGIYRDLPADHLLIKQGQAIQAKWEGKTLHLVLATKELSELAEVGVKHTGITMPKPVNRASEEFRKSVAVTGECGAARPAPQNTTGVAVKVVPQIRLPDVQTAPQAISEPAATNPVKRGRRPKTPVPPTTQVAPAVIPPTLEESGADLDLPDGDYAEEPPANGQLFPRDGEVISRIDARISQRM